MDRVINILADNSKAVEVFLFSSFLVIISTIVSAAGIGVLSESTLTMLINIGCAGVGYFLLVVFSLCIKDSLY